MSPQPPPGSAVKLYDALVATHPDVERKGKSSPYTSVNGNMFTILSADGTLGMRLADADRDAFIATYRTGLYHAHGTVMKGVRRGLRRPAGAHSRARAVSRQELRLRKEPQAQAHLTAALNPAGPACLSATASMT
jgi:hypothetical protein